MNSSSKKKGYLICIKGRLEPKRVDWFGASGMENTPEGNTLLKLDIHDQSALFGLLDKIRDLGVELISVRLIE